jgi:hypothetical protein
MVSRVFRVIVFLAAVCTFSATALALVFFILFWLFPGGLVFD